MVADEDPLIVRAAVDIRQDERGHLRFLMSTPYLRRASDWQHRCDTLTPKDKMDIASFADLFTNYELISTAKKLGFDVSTPQLVLDSDRILVCDLLNANPPKYMVSSPPHAIDAVHLLIMVWLTLYPPDGPNEERDVVHLCTNYLVDGISGVDMDDSPENGESPWRESFQNEPGLSLDSIVEQCCRLAECQQLQLHDRLRQFEILELLLFEKDREADIAQELARHKLIPISVSLLKDSIKRRDELKEELSISTLDFPTLQWELVERWFSTLCFEPSTVSELVLSEAFSVLVPWPKNSKDHHYGRNF